MKKTLQQIIEENNHITSRNKITLLKFYGKADSVISLESGILAGVAGTGTLSLIFEGNYILGAITGIIAIGSAVKSYRAKRNSEKITNSIYARAIKLEDECNFYHKSNNEMVEPFNQLKNKCEFLENRHELLMAKCDELEKSCNEWINYGRSMESYCNQLQKEYSEMAEHHKELYEHSQKLNDENARLKETINKSSFGRRVDITWAGINSGRKKIPN